MRYICAIVFLLWECAVFADIDHDEVKRLRDKHTIVSLESIYQSFQQRFSGGRILETRVEKRDNRYIYELEALDAGGEVRELYYDARTGELLFYEIYLPDPETGELQGVEIDARTGKPLRIEKEN